MEEEATHQRANLYKYRRWDTNAMKIIVLRELYYGRPSEFNDPFDFRVTMRTDGTRDQWFRLLAELVGQEEASALVDTRKWELPEFQARIRNNMIERQMKAGVFCMSRKCDDILMWSHYADSHRGVCIEFSWDVERTAVFDVEYPCEFPEISIFDPDWRERVLKLLYTKSAQWCYENEVRHIRKEGGGPVEIPPDWITAVIIGCQMPPSDAESVTEVVRRSLPEADVRRAKMRDFDFAIEIE